MSQPSTRYPAPSSEEKALQAKQLALMEASEAREKAWEPILMEEMGYRYGSAGGLEQIPEEELYAAMSPLEQQTYDLQKLAAERELKALRGELEIDPATERGIKEQEQELSERMYRQLGAGWETSTPGIQARAEQQQRALEMRDAIRKGEMTTTEALAQSRAGMTERQRQQLIEQSAEPTARAMSVMGGYETPKSWLERQREKRFESKKLKAQMQAEQMSQQLGAMNCCFTFCEAEGELIDDVKWVRDKCYPRGSVIEKGYRKLSRLLVPLMRKYKPIKWLVRILMTKPLICLAKCHLKKNVYGMIFLPIGYMWGAVWYLFGKYSNIPEYTWEEYGRLL